MVISFNNYQQYYKFASKDDQETMGPALIRHLIYGINFLFILIGCILISIGVSTKLLYNRYGDLVPVQYEYSCNYFIVLGLIIFLVAAFGWFGALNENSLTTLMFSTCLLLVFFLEVTAIVGGYFLRATSYHSLSLTLNVIENGSNDHRDHFWKNVQQDFSCCGVENYKDWTTIDGHLPESCCLHSRRIHHHGHHARQCFQNSTDVLTNGCFKPLENFLQDSSLMFVILGVLSASFQIFGLMMVCHLTSQFRKDYQRV